MSGMTRRCGLASEGEPAVRVGHTQRIVDCARLGWAAGLVAMGLALIAAAAPQTANARWTRVARSPSSSEPYFVCPVAEHRLNCDLIEDPSRGADARGPVAAGAITSGPEQQVSPALFGDGKEGGYSPEDLRSAYNLLSTSAGSGQTVAIVDAFDDPNAESDLKTYRAQYGIAECTAANGCFRKVNESGGTSYPEASAEWGTEISLDLDMVSAICPSSPHPAGRGRQRIQPELRQRRG